jgi:hypothetical protein
VADNDIELVAMHDEKPAPVRGLMDAVAHDLDATEAYAAIVAQRLVVIPGDEYHPRAVPNHAQQLLHNVVVCLWPAGTALDAPEVDDIADQVDDVGVVLREEAQKAIGLAGSGA